MESDSLSLMGPFQFKMFYDSMNCQWKKKMEGLLVEIPKGLT